MNLTLYKLYESKNVESLLQLTLHPFLSCVKHFIDIIFNRIAAGIFQYKLEKKLSYPQMLVIVQIVSLP